MASHGGFNRPVLGKHHHGHLGVTGAHSLEEFEASELGHLEVGDDHVHGNLFQQLERLLGGRRRMHRESRFEDNIPAQVAGGSLVVNDQQSESGRSRLGLPGPVVQLVVQAFCGPTCDPACTLAPLFTMEHEPLQLWSIGSPMATVS